MIRLLAALALAAAAVGAQAQAYPTKPIRLVVPFPPGGSIDIMARRLAIPLTAKLGQSVVVENRAGAGSIVGGTFVAQAPNDGYTLLFASSSTLTLAPAISPKLPYDPVKDFTPVSLVGDLPFLLLVHPSVQASNVQELLALAKARGAGVMNYSSFGNATTNHFFGEMLNSMGGVKITHVPYKGGAPALTALIAGEVQVMFDSTPASMPRVQAGAVKALGITSAKRVSSYPQIPTIAEQGLPELVGGAWFGVLGPGGMSEQIVTLLHKDIIESLAAPEMKAEFAKNGVEMIGSTPREFADFIRRETARWTRIARDNNIRAE
jgi:tripartite-type tricarboxylate transporter receptor subunit TctC